MRDSMVIYRSFFEAINELETEQQAIVWNAVMEYGFNFHLVELEGIPKTIFSLIKPQLDANLRRYENGMKPKTKHKQDRSKSKANVNDNDNDNDHVNANASSQPKKESTPAFKPPTQEEVVNFFVSNGYTAEAGTRCFQYYEDGSWKDSTGKKIISWKQKVRGVWFKPENKEPNAPRTGFGYTRGSNYNPAGSHG